MKLLKIASTSAFQIISVVFVLGYLLGILNIHFSDRNEYCAMTYMFEYPQFVRISVPENSIYPQYGLYAYSEGRFTERARKMWFDGVPVLYLPGNSGSHMQARSLASVALRKALSSGQEFHFDYFTISYNEELSGLYGGVLQSQTKFAAACIHRILNLYRSNRYTKNIPSSVILIGHSMGGVIAKRLMAYPSTLNSTSIAISLAAPLQAPAVNFDVTMNDYYMLMEGEWKSFIKNEDSLNKLLLSFGNGPRDVLMQSALTFSNDSYINALTTSIPGVWVSPNHVGIVWCKQLVQAINRYLFSVIDLQTNQMAENKEIVTSKAMQYFQANRSMFLNPSIVRQNQIMQSDAFWYEDNRRIYQIARPDIERTTYLMIRLVNFPQNRFVAIEAVNTYDKDWVFGCNAQFTSNAYRYCKQATSLTELSRWTGAATHAGKRKLATVHLHSLIEDHPDWTHVIVKVSSIKKPVTLNVDINDYASRQITVNLPSDFSFGKTIVKQETEANSLYYELILPGFDLIHQAYLLYVEPTANCKASQYHASAEVHVPWAKNNEYFHYFTHLKQSPMKLRLYNSNPNVTKGLGTTEHVKITILLDPQCTFTISIASTWYYRLAQFVRNYTTVLIPYVAAIILLAARSNILSLKEKGTCMSIHSALMSEGVKPYYALVFARLAATFLLTVPTLPFVFENASWKNQELQYFVRSLLVLPAYMIALGIINITAAVILVTMIFSSQLAHRLLFRIIWRGGPGLVEKVATGLQKVPMVVSAAIICAAPLSCGAASLVAGGAFYAFMLSKMYEDYLEDYVYKIMAKAASRACHMFFKSKKRKQDESESRLIVKETLNKGDEDDTQPVNAVENETTEIVAINRKNKLNTEDDNNIDNESSPKEIEGNTVDVEDKCEEPKRKTDDEIDDELNSLNFHMTLFFMWMAVTAINVPALLTWARNFKYSMVLKPDTSYHTGLIMSACSACVWQMNGPRKHLKYYDAVAALLFTMAVTLLVLGPMSLTVVNYGVTFMYIVITIQQLFDQEDPNFVGRSTPLAYDATKDKNAAGQDNSSDKSSEENKSSFNTQPQSSNDTKAGDKTESKDSSNEQSSESNNPGEDCVCNESRIYNVFKNLRDKFSFSED